MRACETTLCHVHFQSNTNIIAGLCAWLWNLCLFCATSLCRAGVHIFCVCLDTFCGGADCAHRGRRQQTELKKHLELFLNGTNIVCCWDDHIHLLAAFTFEHLGEPTLQIDGVSWQNNALGGNTQLNTELARRSSGTTNTLAHETGVHVLPLVKSASTGVADGARLAILASWVCLVTCWRLVMCIRSCVVNHTRPRGASTHPRPTSRRLSSQFSTVPKTWSCKNHTSRNCPQCSWR